MNYGYCKVFFENRDLDIRFSYYYDSGHGMYPPESELTIDEIEYNCKDYINVIARFASMSDRDIQSEINELVANEIEKL